MTLDELLENIPKQAGQILEKAAQFKFGIAYFTALKSLDAFSTYLIVDEFGTAGEKNPVIRFLMERFDTTPGLVLFSSVYTSMFIGMCFLFDKYGKNYDNKFIPKYQAFLYNARFNVLLIFLTLFVTLRTRVFPNSYSS